MKKLIPIILILTATSLSAIDLYTYGGLSYDYKKVGVDYYPDLKWFEAGLAAGVSQEIWKFDLYAEVEQITEMNMSGVLSWKPEHQDYYVRGGLWIGFLNIEYEHLCMHEVDNSDWSRNGGYDRVTVGFDSRRSFKGMGR